MLRLGGLHHYHVLDVLDFRISHFAPAPYRSHRHVRYIDYISLILLALLSQLGRFVQCSIRPTVIHFVILVLNPVDWRGELSIQSLRRPTENLILRTSSA